MPTKRMRRGELIVAAVIVLIAVLGFGGYQLNQVMYKENEPQLFEEATRSVNLGEPMTITYREIGKQCNYVRWNGDVELTVQSATLYSSYSEALEAEGYLGEANNRSLVEDGPFLVTKLDVLNIDAVENDLWWNNDKDEAPEGGIVLEMGMFDIYLSSPFGFDGGSPEVLAWCTWLANDQTSGLYEKASIDLRRGETAHIVLGFSLDEDEAAKLGDAFLVCSSVFDRFYLGSPSLEGGV